MFIENEGAIFKGSSLAHPDEIRSHKKKAWVAYQGKVPKPIGWGREISAEEAQEWIDEAEGGGAAA